MRAMTAKLRARAVRDVQSNVHSARRQPIRTQTRPGDGKHLDHGDTHRASCASAFGAFDITAHNSFAQRLPAFALSMIAVGLAVPSALGHVTVRVGARIVLSTFFGTAAILYAVIAAITGGNAMLCQGTEPESGPTLMIVVPIVTVPGIMFMRQPDARAPRKPRNRKHKPQTSKRPTVSPGAKTPVAHEGHAHHGPHEPSQ